MIHSEDSLVLILLIVVIFYLIFRRWMSFSSIGKWLNHSKKKHGSIKGEIPDLLRHHGYEVISAKVKIPLYASANDENFESRMYIDYIAQADGEQYIVIVARDRKPFRLSGSALRDHFLTHYLLCRPDGILYVDREKGSVKEIHFDIPHPLVKKKVAFNWMYVAAVVIGMLISWGLRN